MRSERPARDRSGSDRRPRAEPAGDERCASTCGLSQPAFCDTFDNPFPVTNRAGQLNGIVWGVSRAIGNNNLGQGQLDAWGVTTLVGCNGTTSVQPENDVIVCNGQVREAVNDLHTVTNLAMYPKQPFDFAGRTGIVAFDVSNDTLGTHTEWPEFWISDQPVPTPFTFEANWLGAPRNAVGLRFSAEAGAGQGAQLASSCPNDGNAHWSMGSAVAVRNYAVDDQDNGGSIRAQILGCVTRASGPGQMNHVELSGYPGQLNLGWLSTPPSGRSFTISGVNGLSNATAVLLTFNFYHYDPPQSLNYVVNGHAHSMAWPYPGTTGYTWRTLAASVPLSDVVNGTNTINIHGSNQPIVVANVDLILAGAGGVVAP